MQKTNKPMTGTSVTIGKAHRTAETRKSETMKANRCKSSTYLDAMLEAVELPASIADLNTGLTNMNRDTLPHGRKVFPKEQMTQRVRQYTTKNCLAEIGNKCIRTCRKLRTREMEKKKKKKKKSFERGVYEDAPGKKQWPWRCEALPSSLYPSKPQIAHTLALTLLLRKSPASFAISSLTVVNRTASLLSFTQTVVFSLYLQIVEANYHSSSSCVFTFAPSLLTLKEHLSPSSLGVQ
jgi:hypothetical protein